MTLSFTNITALPDPPQKTDPTNFATKADAFVDALVDFCTEMNVTISELNTITSGLDQASTIAAYNSGTTYNFPDVVACTDGYSYRCVDTGVVGQDPITDDGTYWVRLNLAPELKSINKEYTVTANSGAVALDCSKYDSFIINATGAMTLSFTGLTAGENITIDVTGGSNITWPAGMEWPGSTLPTFSASGEDTVIIRKRSGDYRAALCGLDWGAP